MSERSAGQYAFGLALCLAAGSLVAGCDTAPASPIAPIVRCLDNPLPVRTPVAGEEEPIELHYDPGSGFIKEAPIIDTLLERKLEQANVMVEYGDSKGSGFLTLAPDGSLVVITAAHVVQGGDFIKIKITDSKKQETGVADACFLYEKDGNFFALTADENEEGLADVDIAILRLTGSIGGTPLELAEKSPERGRWVQFVNNQLESTPGYPAEYTGLVVNPSSYLGITALTGLEPWRKKIGGELSYTFNKGGSGGLVADPKTGQVIGISVIASKGYGGAEATKSAYGVTFDAAVGHETGIIPLEATIVPVEALRRALESMVYRDGTPQPAATS